MCYTISYLDTSLNVKTLNVLNAFLQFWFTIHLLQR